jgi:hypothetical protein
MSKILISLLSVLSSYRAVDSGLPCGEHSWVCPVATRGSLSADSRLMCVVQTFPMAIHCHSRCLRYSTATFHPSNVLLLHLTLSVPSPVGLGYLMQVIRHPRVSLMYEPNR